MHSGNKYFYKPLQEPVPITEQEWPDDSIPLVCTRTMTYMHEKYIKDCIEGILMQKTTFPVQVLIHDDASTDKTPDIVREYERRYPRLIKAYYQTENSYTKKDKLKRRSEFNKWRIGKYEAICEGDDYWTDPYKLQKQVDFLEDNPEYSIVSHRYSIYDQEENILSTDIDGYLFNDSIQGLIFDKHSYLEHHYIQTHTAVYRKDMLDVKLLLSLHSGDMTLFYCCLKNGPGYYFNFDGGVYRRHLGGIYSKKNEYEKIRVGFYLYKSLYFKTLDKIFEKHFNSHCEMLFGKIKTKILESNYNSCLLIDTYSILKTDFHSFHIYTFLTRIIKLIYWLMKSIIKKVYFKRY